MAFKHYNTIIGEFKAAYIIFEMAESMIIISPGGQRARDKDNLLA